MTLRDYQQAAVDHCLAYEGMAPLIVCPTGSGKSHIIAELIKQLCKGNKTNAMIVSHRKEILEQNAEKLIKAWPQCPLGIYSASLGKKRMDRVSIAQVQSIGRRLERLPELKCLVIDEAHLVPNKGAGQYLQLVEAARRLNPELRIIGLTATPYRLQSGYLHKGLNAIFDGIAYEIDINTLIGRGFLAPLKGKQPATQADLSSVQVSGGEYILGQMARAFDKEAFTDDAISEILAYGRDRKSWIIFTASIEHAEKITSKLKSSGINTSIVTGETMPLMRQKILADYKQGKIRAIVNCDVLTTGFDAPCVDMIVLLRATKSTSLYVQMLGRGMRPNDGKDNCLVLDFGGNLYRHGPLDNLIIKDPNGKGADAPPPSKICPNCRAVVATSTVECPDCSFIFEIQRGKHEDTALIGEFLESEQRKKPQQHLVVDCAYSKHNKKGSPDSLRVTYLNEHDEVYSEWVCLEHEGFARDKAKRWWKSRGGFEPVPPSVDDALDRLHELKKVISIWTKKDGKFDRVLSCQLGDRPIYDVEVNTNVLSWEEL